MTSILLSCLSNFIALSESSALRACGETLYADDSYAEESSPGSPLFWSVQSSSAPVVRFPIARCWELKLPLPKRCCRGVIPRKQVACLAEKADYAEKALAYFAFSSYSALYLANQTSDDRPSVAWTSGLANSSSASTPSARLI